MIVWRYHRFMGDVCLSDMRRMRLRVFGRLLLRGRLSWRGSSSSAELLYLAETAQDAGLVGEVGFNAGLSARAFLTANPMSRVVSFDLCETRSGPATRIAKQMIDKEFPGRHTLICGDSTITVPAYAQEHPDVRFDVVFIDGGHQYETARADIANMRALSTPDTAVIMDDLIPWFAYGAGPYKAWTEAVGEGVVKQVEVFKDGKPVEELKPPGLRSWALGHYLH